MRKYEGKTKKKLLDEIDEMRSRIKELEASETEHKQVEEVLRESEEKFRTIFELSPEAIVLLDTKGSVLDVNHRILDWLGYEPAEFIEKNLVELPFLPEKSKAKAVESFTQRMLGREIVPYELTFISKSGEKRIGLTAATLVVDREGIVLYDLVMISDITERKRMEEVLQESEERYRDLFENANDLVQSIAPDGHFLYVNKAWRQILGYSEEEVANLTLWDIIHPDSIPHCREIFQKVMSGEEVSNVEVIFVAKDGNLVTVEGNANCRFKQGEIVSTRGIFRNVTERKQLEEARMERAVALARAEEVQQSRQRIIAMQESLRMDIAQQIHGTVQNRLIILMHRLADLKSISPSEQISTEVADLRQKLGELLEDHIRPISHRLFPSILRRGLVPALQSLVDQFEATQSIDMKLSEKLKKQEKINPRFITGRVRLAAYRIVEEALTNVTKHANASRITVKLGLSSEGWLRLMVRDDGRGFNMESASAGLGILMMQDYAEVVSGSCVINSFPGKGTKVTATVPLAEHGAEYPERAWILE
jgi:PAS domain S-box-containing protein